MDEVASVDQEPPPLDRETVRLLGAYISQRRADLMLSPETFVAGMSRNEKWLAAVERGEVELTEEMLLDIGVALAKAGEKDDVEQVAASIRRYPFGPEAVRLRAAAGVQPPAVSPTSTPTGFGPDSIAGVDRLLVVAPGAVFLAFLTLIVRMLSWSGTAPAPKQDEEQTHTLLSLLNSVFLPGVVVATLVFALGLTFVDRRIGRAARYLRPRESADDLAWIHEMCRHDGIEIRPESSDWRLTYLQPHLIEKHRAPAMAASLRTAFCERLVPALVLASAVSLVAVVLVTAENGPSFYDAGPIVIAVAALALTLAAHLEGARSSKECAAEVTRGLGWKTDRTQLPHETQPQP